jgi:hypothetical protein
MEAWNANMDLQLCLDYFSIITYMTDYVAKPEKKTTEILKLVNKEKKKANSSHKNTMYALANAYLTHREMGECETYYKLDPALHFKQSNIRTIFVATGFPQNRSKFLRKCKNKNEKEEGIEVDGHEGVFMETESIHIKYSMRPEIIFLICLAQFVMWYTLMNSRGGWWLLKVNLVINFGLDQACVVALHLQTGHRSSLATDVVVESCSSVPGVPEEIVAVLHFRKAVSGGGSVRST